VLAWIETAILTGYGLILTASGLLIQVGVIKAAAHADRLALKWHPYLWDPWFLIWGIFVFLASGSPSRSPPGRRTVSSCVPPVIAVTSEGLNQKGTIRTLREGL
jgi:hypothetical protein